MSTTDEIKLRLPDESDVLLAVRGDLPMHEIDDRLARYTNKLRQMNPVENEVTGGSGYTPKMADVMVDYRNRLYRANKLKPADVSERRQAERGAMLARQRDAHEASLQQQGKETLEAARAEVEAAWLRQGGTKSSFSDWWRESGEQETLAERAKSAVAAKRNLAAQPGRDY
ncbi:hypothetical protein BH23CHL2_BH23CHL2_24990 [soil metagenome]